MLQNGSETLPFNVNLQKPQMILQLQKCTLNYAKIFKTSLMLPVCADYVI